MQVTEITQNEKAKSGRMKTELICGDCGSSCQSGSWKGCNYHEDIYQLLYWLYHDVDSGIME